MMQSIPLSSSSKGTWTVRNTCNLNYKSFSGERQTQAIAPLASDMYLTQFEISKHESCHMMLAAAMAAILGG